MLIFNTIYMTNDLSGSVDNLWDLDKDEVLVENNAQSIYDHITELEKDRQNNEKRWFWELLQNAKDSIDDDEIVSVRVTLTDTELIFSHTGKPFQRKDLLHLIFHGSSKKKAEGKTGRFGTGFMTTHLLSKKVRIMGELEEGGYFDFILDRNADDHAQQKKSLDISYDNFKLSRTDENPFKDEFKTSFIYDLTTEDLDKQTKVATDGLEMLRYILPVVLALNPKLKSVQSHTGQIVLRKESVKQVYKETEIQTHTIQNSESESLKVVMLNNDDFNLTVILEKIGDTWQLQKLSNEYPRLFFDFPLFGTENFGTSFIINSLKFDPRRERDGIHLGTSLKSKVAKNKEIIENAFVEFIKLAEYLGSGKTENIHNLYYFKEPSDYVWLDKEWIMQILASLVNDLFALECLYHSDKAEVAISMDNSKVPYADGAEITDSFYKSLISLYPDKSVKDSLVNDWLNIIIECAEITGDDIEDLECIITTEKMCGIIESSVDLESFTKMFFNTEEISIVWLNNFYSLLDESEMLRYSLSHKIIPNQKKIFLQRNAEDPKFEKGNNFNLKKVANLYNWEIENELVHELVKPIEGFESIDTDKIIDKLESLNRKFDIEDLTEDTKKAFVLHLKALINLSKDDKLRDIYVFINEKRDSEADNLMRPLYQEDGKKLMAPRFFWSTSFPHYNELISEKFVLPDLYSDLITPEEFQHLFDFKLVYQAPLLVRKKKASRTDLNNLLFNKENITALCDDKGELKNFEIEFSEIPYFTKGDDGVLAKASDSIKSCTNLLRFILFDVLPKDPLFNKHSFIDSVRYSNCYWSAKLKDTKWVAYKYLTDDGPSIKSEMASTITISAIIEQEPELTKALNTEKTAIFFNTLGISIADILRSFIPDEGKKLKWDLIFSKLLMNKKINLDIAQEMLEDENLQEIYLKKKKDRDNINRNQTIGSAFENAFKNIFESSEMKSAGLDIKRKPLGSDFELLIESDIIENEKEVLFEIGSILIELKATIKNVAEMTQLQGQTAATTNQRFVLAVLPLGNYEINQDNLKKHARFITDIKEVIIPHYEALQTYDTGKKIAIADSDVARLAIEDGSIRYQIKSEMWTLPSVRETPSLNFTEFLDWIKIKDK